MDPSEKKTSNKEISDEDYVDLTDTSMSSEDNNIFEDDVGSSADKEGVVDNVGASGMINNGVVCNGDIGDEGCVNVSETSMPSKDNTLENGVGSSVDKKCVEDNVEASGIINNGVDNAENKHGRQRHQNPTQETSQESKSKENTNGEKLEDERNEQWSRFEDEVVVNQVRNSACRQNTFTASKKVSASVNIKDSPCSEQTEMPASNGVHKNVANELQAKSCLQKCFYVCVSSKNRREIMRKKMEQFFRTGQPLAKNIKVIQNEDFWDNQCMYTRLLVYALPSFGRVIVSLPEAIYEHFRLSTFGHSADLNLEQGVVMQLARDGFFCDINGYIVCNFCAYVITGESLNQGLHHLRWILQNHRCPLYGNVPISMYGVDGARVLGSTTALTPSGQPYQGSGVGQQNRFQPGTPYHTVVTSSTSFDQQNRLLPVNQVSQDSDVQACILGSSNEVNEQERETREGANDGDSVEGVSFQGEQTASNVCEHTPERNNHQDNTSALGAMSVNSRPCRGDSGCHWTDGRKTSHTKEQDRTQVYRSQMEVDRLGDSERYLATGVLYGTRDWVQSFINSELGRNVFQMGFRRDDVIIAVGRLRNRREIVTFDNIMRELENIGAHPE